MKKQRKLYLAPNSNLGWPVVTKLAQTFGLIFYSPAQAAAAAGR